MLWETEAEASDESSNRPLFVEPDHNTGDLATNPSDQSSESIDDVENNIESTKLLILQ